MVDAGGGNGILGILEKMNVDMAHIHHIFVTHEHTDHILGIVWMVRMIATAMKKGKYEGELRIYCHPGLADTISTLCGLTLQWKFYKMIGEKAKQFGFTMHLKNGKKFTCAGDEPYNPECKPYVEGSQWLLHEAFCLYGDRERFQPYEKHHSTVKEACELAESLSIPNLVLWHTEDKNLSHRKELYTAEGKEYYHGNLLVPDDGEIIKL